MGFCENRAAKIIAQLDNAWAEKMKKKSNFPDNIDFLQFFMKHR